MSKLDWSRASERQYDPARYQRSNDALAPDQPVKRKKRRPEKPLTAKQRRQHDALEARRKAIEVERKRRKAAAKALEAERQKRNAAAKAERRALAKEQQKRAAEKKRIKEAERKARADARRAAFEEYSESPEYAAKIAREQAKMASMKRSNLQVWIEEETGLDADRQALRRQWRDRLLPRQSPSE